MNIEEEKQLIVEKILNTNDKNLIAKVTRLIEKEQATTYWTKLTAELRAELEANKQVRIFEKGNRQGAIDRETADSLQKFSGGRLS